MHDFAQDAGVKQAQVIDSRDPGREAFHEMEEIFEFVLREHVEDGDLGVRAANAIDTTVSLDQADGVPGEVVVDDDSTVLEVLTFGQNVGTDQDVDLLVPTGIGLSFATGANSPRIGGRSFGWLPLSIRRICGLPADFSHSVFDSVVSFR